MSVAASIERLHELRIGELDKLLLESEQAGFQFLRRLADDWTSGTNRFERSGEVLFGARLDDTLIGVCGLNVDPYAADERAGRVRHLYVLSAMRRRGVGRCLVETVIEAARGRFDTLRLRTEDAAAAKFYEALGFHPSAGDAHCAHVMQLAAGASAPRAAADRKPLHEHDCWAIAPAAFAEDDEHMSATARHVLVAGRVQGVGFRWFVREQAVGLRLTGWVRNLRDGRVEAWLEGSPEALATMIDCIRSARPPAHVEGITVEEREATGHGQFEVQRSPRS